jgi:ParB family chromosome partitioning protein
MKKRPTETISPQSNGPLLSMLLLASIDPSLTNPRRRFDETKHNELTDSIRQHGVLQPILVRPAKVDYRFEIIAGERRFRASKSAELIDIPAFIRDMSDEQVLDAQITENLIRADIHPLDEALGYKHVLETVPGMTVAELARRVSHPQSYVEKRLKLNDLIPEVQEAFGADRITLGHAVELGRLPADIQKAGLAAAFKDQWDGTRWTNMALPVSALHAWVKQNAHLELKKAPFKLDDAKLVLDAGACAACPKRTGFNTALFDDIQSDSCLDRGCYQSKLTALTLRKKLDLTAKNKGVPPVTISATRYHQAGTPAEARVDWYSINGKPCGFETKALIIHGEGIGTTKTVCVDAKCPDHGGLVSHSSHSSSSKPAAGTAESRLENGKRKQELFDLRVAEQVRIRALNLALETVNAVKVFGSSKLGTLSRGYLAQIGARLYEKLGGSITSKVDQVLDLKNTQTWYGSLLGPEHLLNLSNDELAKFIIACSVYHFGENEYAHHFVDQSDVIDFVCAHGVDYLKLDADCRIELSPKAHLKAHEEYLAQVLAGEISFGEKKDSKRPYWSRPAVYVDAAKAKNAAEKKASKAVAKTGKTAKTPAAKAKRQPTAKAAAARAS